MTEQEREKALALLAQTRQTLRDAVAGVSDEEANWKPSPERWSILQYVEHLSIADDGLVALVERIMAGEPTPETVEERKAREAKIRATPVPRGVNRAPAALVPLGKTANLKEALAAFEAARDRTVEFTQTVEGDLRSHFHDHGVFGPMDGYQWLTGNARHVEMHAAHIAELRELFAKRELV